MCWQPKSHYIKSLHCFAEIFFFLPPFLGVQTNVFRSLPYETKNCFTLVSDLKIGPGRSEKYCFAPLLMGWKITGETPRKRRRLRCKDVRTFSREDFFGCFIHQNNTPLDSIPQENWQLFFSDAFEHTNITGGFAPVDSPKFMPPKKPWRVHRLFQNNSFKGGKLGSGVTFFFSRNPQKTVRLPQIFEVCTVCLFLFS